MSLELQVRGDGWKTRRSDCKMKQICGCLYLIVIYSVTGGVFSASTQKNIYETTQDKFVANQENTGEHMMQLLCNALDASKSVGGELLLTSDDLDRRVSLNGISCRMRGRRSHASVGDSGDANLQLRRQVDPLQSCVEAKCSGNSGSYFDCIYKNCISGFQLGLRSLLLASKRTARISATSGSLKTRKVDGKERHPTLRDGSLEQEQEEEEKGEASGQTSATVGDISSSSLEAGLRVMRRGFNDIADVCVQHHCGSFNPHSMNFFSCVESHCAFR